MSHRVLDAELIARAGQLGATQEIGKALGVSDRALYNWVRAAKEGTGSELEMQLLQILAGLPEQEP
jgi:transposase-like protein